MPLFVAMLRSSTAVWVGPAAMAMAVWYANREARFGPFDPYVTERTAAAAAPLFLTLAVMAACAAWEGGRLRRASWVTMPNARPTVIAAAPLLGPPAIAAVVVMAAGLLWKLRMGDAGFVPDVRFLPTLAAIVLAWILIGYAIGQALPPYVAAPAMLAGVYCWMALPGTLTAPLWLRYLTGDEIGECCSLASDIDPRVLTAPLIFAVGLIASALLLLQAQALPRRSLMLLAAAPFVLGMVGGGAVARDLSTAPSIPRSAALLVCAEGAPRVCVWPEHTSLLPRVSQGAASAAAVWRTFGVVIPDEFSEIDPREARDGTRSFGPWSGLAQNETPLVEVLATSMMPDIPPCAYDRSANPEDDPHVTPEESFTAEAYPGFAAYDSVLAWFTAAAGADDAYLTQRFGEDEGWRGPDVLSTVETIRASPVSQQRAWLAHNLAALSSCDVPPTFAP